MPNLFNIFHPFSTHLPSILGEQIGGTLREDPPRFGRAVGIQGAGWDGKPMENLWKIGIFMGIFLRMYKKLREYD